MQRRPSGPVHSEEQSCRYTIYRTSFIAFHVTKLNLAFSYDKEALEALRELTLILLA